MHKKAHGNVWKLRCMERDSVLRKMINKWSGSIYTFDVMSRSIKFEADKDNCK